MGSAKVGVDEGGGGAGAGWGAEVAEAADCWAAMVVSMALVRAMRVASIAIMPRMVEGEGERERDSGSGTWAAAATASWDPGMGDGFMIGSI